MDSYLRQCCLPAPDLPTVLLHPDILHLSLPVSRCQWSRVTNSPCLSVSDTKNGGLLFPRLRLWKFKGSVHLDEGGEVPVLGVPNVVVTFFCALRSQDNKAPFESSSLCSTSRCYIIITVFFC